MCDEMDSTQIEANRIWYCRVTRLTGTRIVDWMTIECKCTYMAQLWPLKFQSWADAITGGRDSALER